MSVFGTRVLDSKFIPNSSIVAPITKYSRSRCPFMACLFLMLSRLSFRAAFFALIFHSHATTSSSQQSSHISPTHLPKWWQLDVSARSHLWLTFFSLCIFSLFASPPHPILLETRQAKRSKSTTPHLFNKCDIATCNQVRDFLYEEHSKVSVDCITRAAVVLYGGRIHDLI
jgi:hypothetical protein